MLEASDHQPAQVRVGPVAGIGTQVGEVASILGTDGEAEMVAVIRAALGEGTAVGGIAGRP